jgi:hypothetical protein
MADFALLVREAVQEVSTGFNLEYISVSTNVFHCCILCV